MLYFYDKKRLFDIFSSIMKFSMNILGDDQTAFPSVMKIIVHTKKNHSSPYRVVDVIVEQFRNLGSCNDNDNVDGRVWSTLEVWKFVGAISHQSAR